MQESQYDVSIIVPVHNREKLIIPCIKSINAQTYDRAKWEVIFVDDGSTDKSVEVIESLIDKKINYRIIKREIPSGNASAPRNEGIKASRAKYVFFLDSDDYIHPELLEKGCEIAFRNDSDIVYFKIKSIDRGGAIRPFKKSCVDLADIFKDHLFRALNPLKFFKRTILIENDILFNPAFVKREDQVFCIIAILNSNKISILADLDYYMSIRHVGDHLSTKKANVAVLTQAYIDSLWYIYCSPKDIDFKKKAYNALLIRIVETSKELLQRIKLSQNIISIFTPLVKILNIYKDLFDLSQIYESEKIPTLLFLSEDFESFYKYANETKEPFKSLLSTFKSQLENLDGFSKAWIYGGKIIVLDFIINNNKIAFDIEVDTKSNTLIVWLFCRNDKNALKHLENKAIKINDNKICIFKDSLTKQEILIQDIKAKYTQIQGFLK